MDRRGLPNSTATEIWRWRSRSFPSTMMARLSTCEAMEQGRRPPDIVVYRLLKAMVDLVLEGKFALLMPC